MRIISFGTSNALAFEPEMGFEIFSSIIKEGGFTTRNINFSKICIAKLTSKLTQKL